MYLEAILGRKKKTVNNSDYPDHAIERVARCILPDILAYFESEEGQQEFKEWKALQEAMKEKKTDAK
jgi:hypothetical protein